ncbi:MAG: D-alanyl-D-alanine carboxypeptidase/D-alanyl-D-alanine-endopeptidase [Gemmatimonadaceae bacterium]|nr:D-alanyl-D-alanine carboxypeptidase/D-alanyl-D-alanine-endopeptidase [Gemmatimonadaceae bacterium]
MPSSARTTTPRWALGAALLICACAPAARVTPPVAPLPAVVAPPPQTIVPPPVDARLALARVADSVFSDPKFRTAAWGALIIDPATGDTLYSLNPRKLVMPASNMKVITGAVVLHLLGPDFRFRTTFSARCGPTRTRCTELFVTGRGDPTISPRFHSDPMTPLRAVADSLRAHGVTGFSGALVASGDAFPGSIYGYGWEFDDLGEDYGAGIDDLLFYEGLGPVEAVAPSGLRVRTFKPTPDPRQAYLTMLSSALRERGLAHEGTAATDSGRSLALAQAETLFVIQSPPLRDILGPMLKPSQNQIAEILLRTIGLERTGVGRADSGAAVVRRQLLEWGADSMEFSIRDGSGLSRHNYVTPATMVRVLSVMQRHPHAAVFYEALPAVGVSGTVQNWLRGTSAEGNAHGKTGTLGSVRAFSGYVRTAGGSTLIYSFICNNYLVPTSAVTVAIQAMVRHMAESPLPAL